MNSVSIEKLVDVELWQGLLEVFGVKSHAPTWLIEPIENPRKLTTKQFYDLAMQTEEERELNAIALFMWMQSFSFDDFALRCLNRIVESGRYSVIQEAMLYKVGPFEEEEKQVLRDSLTGEKRGSVLECEIALLALGEVDDNLLRLLLERICVYLGRESSEFDWIRDAKMLKGVLPWISEGAEPLHKFCKVLLHYTKKIPKNRSTDYKVCENMGIGYFAQVVLAYRLQEDKWNRSKDLEELLMAQLGLRAFPWTKSEKLLLREIVPKCKVQGFPVVNVENLKWSMEQGWIGIFSADLRYSGVAEFLQPYQRDSLVVMMQNSFEDVTETKLQRLVEKYTETFDLLFSQWDVRLEGVYKKVRKVKKYPVFEVSWMKDPREVMELVKKVREDRESEAYKTLMERIGKNKEVLKDADVLEEFQVYCLMHCPEKLQEATEEYEEDNNWYEGEEDDWYEQ